MLREIFEEKFVTGEARTVCSTLASAPNLPLIFSKYSAAGRVLLCRQRLWIIHISSGTSTRLRL